MKTIILNGSPKPNPRDSNSRFFAEAFVRNMQQPCEIRRIVGADPGELARYVRDFDAIIIILPLYVHAMPGPVMKFIEHLEPAPAGGKSIGFIVQSGFPETAQHKYVERYYAELARQLNYDYLGTVSKGGTAFTYLFPQMSKKALALVSDLGVVYEATDRFDASIMSKLSQPYQWSRPTLWKLAIVVRLGLVDFVWNDMLKKHNAFERRLDRPFLE